MKEETMTITMAQEELDKLTEICTELGISVEELVRQFIHYVVRHEMLLRIVAEAQAATREQAAHRNESAVEGDIDGGQEKDR